MSHQWDATFSGYNSKLERTKRKITVFELTREAAVQEVMDQAKMYGLQDATVDHITRVG